MTKLISFVLAVVSFFSMNFSTAKMALEAKKLGYTLERYAVYELTNVCGDEVEIDSIVYSNNEDGTGLLVTIIICDEGLDAPVAYYEINDSKAVSLAYSYEMMNQFVEDGYELVHEYIN